MAKRFGILPGVDVQTARGLRYPSPSGAPPSSLVSLDGPAAPPRRPDPGLSPFVRQVYPPWIAKIGGVSKDFNVSDFAMALPANGTATSTNLRFQLPSDNVGWLQEMSLYILTPTAAASVVWTARINGGPISGFANKRTPPGVANIIVIDINDMQVRIPQGGTVDILITNESAVAWTVGGALAGWYHPRAAELAYWGEEL